MWRVCTMTLSTADWKDSKSVDLAQSNRTLTKSSTCYQTHPYERRCVALPPSIIPAQCQSIRTHNSCEQPNRWEGQSARKIHSRTRLHHLFMQPRRTLGPRDPPIRQFAVPLHLRRSLAQSSNDRLSVLESAQTVTPPCRYST